MGQIIGIKWELTVGTLKHSYNNINIFKGKKTGQKNKNHLFINETKLLILFI